MTDIEYYFDEMCRLCMKKIIPLYDIFDNDTDGVSLLEKVALLCNIQVSPEDNFPKTICKSCRKKLKNAYDFKTMCLSSEKLLNNFVSIPEPDIKIEPEELFYYLEVEEFDFKPDDDLNISDIEALPCFENKYMTKQINNIKEDNECFKNEKNKDDVAQINVMMPTINDCEMLSNESSDAKSIRSEIIKTELVEKQAINDSDSDDSNRNKRKITRRRKRVTKSDKIDPNKRHKCKVCKKRFVSELRVKLHMQRIHKDIYLDECNVICPKCGMKFQHTRNLKRHLVYHNTDSYFACNFCDTKLYSKKSWRKHIKIHDEATNVICKICNKNILSKISYIYHMDYHKNRNIISEKLFYSCGTCNIDFKSFEDLEKHSLQNHCLNIPDEHDYLEDLNSKKNIKHENNVKTEENGSHFTDSNPPSHENNVLESYYANNTSEKEFGVGIHESSAAQKVMSQEIVTSVDDSLINKSHGNSAIESNISAEVPGVGIYENSVVQNVVPGEIVPYNKTCIADSLINIESSEAENSVNSKQGDIKLTKYLDLKMKYKLSNINASVEFSCNICSRVYKNLVDLKFHVNECSSKINLPKSFMCDICGKCFKSAWILSTHKNGHSSAKPFICDVCGQGFKWHNDLSNHKSRIHEKLRPYVCKICGKKCGTSATLKSHMRYHTGERPYVCSVCNVTFTQNSSLKEHMYKHNGGEEGSCPICNKVFKTPLRLRTHVKRHNTQRQLFPCDLCGRMFTEKSSVRKHKLKIHPDMYQHI